jgi:hypothetical protein
MIAFLPSLLQSMLPSCLLCCKRWHTLQLNQQSVEFLRPSSGCGGATYQQVQCTLVQIHAPDWHTALMISAHCRTSRLHRPDTGHCWIAGYLRPIPQHSDQADGCGVTRLRAILLLHGRRRGPDLPVLRLGSSSSSALVLCHTLVAGPLSGAAMHFEWL